MKDIFGHELVLGDIVAVTAIGYKTLMVGEVIGFTKKMVEIGFIDWNKEFKKKLERPSNVVKRIV